MSLAQRKHAPLVEEVAEHQGQPEVPQGFTMLANMKAKPTTWQIKGHLAADSLALIYGPPKCGKSFMAIDWAACIASGTPWNGFRTTPGAVFYICGEGHSGIYKRFLVWSRANGVDLSNLTVAVTDSAVPLTVPEMTLKVEGMVRRMADQYGAPSLIVVDTLARNFGANENATEDMNRFVQHVDQIRKPWKATGLVVHHTGKNEASGPRGALALRGAIDTSFSVSKSGPLVAMEPIDMKDAALPTSKSFRLVVMELEDVRDEDGDAETSCHLELESADYTPQKATRAGLGLNQERVLTQLERLTQEQRERLKDSGKDPDGANVATVDLRLASIEAGIGKTRWPKLKESLVERGLIVIEGPHVRAAT